MLNKILSALLIGALIVFMLIGFIGLNLWGWTIVVDEMMYIMEIPKSGVFLLIGIFALIVSLFAFLFLIGDKK